MLILPLTVRSATREAAEVTTTTAQNAAGLVVNAVCVDQPLRATTKLSGKR